MSTQNNTIASENANQTVTTARRSCDPVSITVPLRLSEMARTKKGLIVAQRILTRITTVYYATDDYADRSPEDREDIAYTLECFSEILDSIYDEHCDIRLEAKKQEKRDHAASVRKYADQVELEAETLTEEEV